MWTSDIGHRFHQKYIVNRTNRIAIKSNQSLHTLTSRYQTAIPWYIYHATQHPSYGHTDIPLSPFTFFFIYFHVFGNTKMMFVGFLISTVTRPPTIYKTTRRFHLLHSPVKPPSQSAKRPMNRPYRVYFTLLSLSLSIYISLCRV